MKLNTLKRFAEVAAALVLLAGGGCRQADITEMDLAVNDKVLNLKASKGSTHVLVWCNSSWSASFTEEIGWASIEKSSGNGDGEFILTYDANTELLRRAVIKIKASGIDEPLEITVNQAGDITVPSLKFLANEREYISWESSDFVEFETNLPESEKGKLKVEVTKDWVQNAAIEDSKVSFYLSQNVSGESRKASLSLTYEDVDENVYRTTFDIVQSALGGSLTFTPSEMTVDSFEAEKIAPCVVSLGTYVNDVTSSVTYEGTEKDWISNVALDGNVVRFKVAANEKRTSRKAVINLKIESRGIDAALAVTQVEYQKELSFDELRATLSAAGQKTFDGDYFVAVVTSDASDDNVQTNPMVAYGNIDTDVAKSTFYVSPEDMHCGIRIRTATPADNTVTKGQKIKVSLAGATLTREDNPVRYTLSGITGNSLSPEGTATLSPAVKTIGELSDNDVFTLVRLQDVEIAVNFGSYANINPVWMDNAQRQNAAVRMLRNAAGECINMLVNTDTP
ncbi:MAG: BACON domain-containing protein, partial [Candidatus Cryptobacteroides sp.]